MFIHSLDEKELENESFKALTGEKAIKIFLETEQEQSIRWSKSKNKDTKVEFVSQKVFSFIKNLNVENKSVFSRYMEIAMFVIPTPQIL